MPVGDRCRIEEPDRVDEVVARETGKGPAGGERRAVQRPIAAVIVVRRDFPRGSRLVVDLEVGEIAVGIVDVPQVVDALAVGIVDIDEAGGDRQLAPLAVDTVAQRVIPFGDGEGASTVAFASAGSSASASGARSHHRRKARRAVPPRRPSPASSASS